jgi:hypothetical protein
MLRNVIAVVVFVTLIAGAVFANDQPIKFPRGKAPVIDGRLEAAEWNDARTFDLVGGGKVYFKYDGSYCYAAVQGRGAGWSQLYLASENGAVVDVHHASSALGSTRYVRDAIGIWQPANDFAWDLRDRVYDDSVQKKMDAYLAGNTWVANNNNMNSKSEIEFKWKPAGKRPFRLAIEYVIDETKQFYPEGWSDDGLNSRLALGFTPRDLKFRLNTWAQMVAE